MRPTLRVLEYRHSQTHTWYLDLRLFNRVRKFFKTKAEAEAERLRQITSLARHGREAVGLPQRELSVIENLSGPLIASAVYAELWRISHGLFFVGLLDSFTKGFARNSPTDGLENKFIAMFPFNRT